MLLFLPAGGKDEYWSRTGWLTRSTGPMTAIGIFVRQHRVAGMDSRDRQNLANIRLASRSGLFGCSVDGVGLLFLPAALQSGTWAHYWSVESINGYEQVVAFDFRGRNVLIYSWAARSAARSVRLASR